MFSPCDAHRRNHHQLDAVCVVVHLACSESFYLVQKIFFIGFRYSIFSASEFHFAEIVCPVRLTFQQQVNLSPFPVGTLSVPTIIPVDGGYTQGVLDLRQMLYTKQFKSISCPSVESGSAMNGIPYSLLRLFALYETQIEQREEIGHLEIDSILGLKNEQESLISIVDRCTRKLWLIKSDYKQEYYVANLIYKYIVDNEIPVKSITTDNGLEFNVLGITAKKLGVKLYKCDPYCSFQRGTNERTNALVRRWIPKGSSMKLKPQIYLDDICFAINSMPRKIFDFKSVYDVESNYK